MTARKKTLKITPRPGGQALPASAGSARVRKEIRRAVDLIHHQDDYDGGMMVLCALAGVEVKWPQFVPTTIADIFSQNVPVSHSEVATGAVIRGEET